MPSLRTCRRETGAPDTLRRWRQFYDWVLEMATRPEPGVDSHDAAAARELHQPVTEVPSSRIVELWRRSPLRALQLVALDDATYYVPTRPDLRRLVDRSVVDRAGYVRERRDCDDFARALIADMGWRHGLNACALVRDYSGGHAYVAAVVTGEGGELEWLVIEPQTDGVVRIDSAPAYSADRGIITI